MRREELYLQDIVEAAEAVAEFIKDIDEQRFVTTDLIRSAVLQKLIVIGEAASRLPKVFRSAHPDIEWPDIVAFRNIVVHAYFGIKWDMVWVTATTEVPQLAEQVRNILLAEFPGLFGEGGRGT